MFNRLKKKYLDKMNMLEDLQMRYAHGEGVIIAIGGSDSCLGGYHVLKIVDKMERIRKEYNKEKFWWMSKL